MILYYAMGGGLGHLVRARAMAHTLGWHDMTVFTASPYAADPRVLGGFARVQVPPELAAARTEYGELLYDTIDRIQPSEIVVDTFAVGILGELPSLITGPAVPLLHVARYVKPELLPPPHRSPLIHFDTTYVVEPLAGEHVEFVTALSSEVIPLELIDPPAHILADQHARIEAHAPAGTPLWLVVHSEPHEETEQLVQYAREMAMIEGIAPRFVVATPEADAFAREPDDDILAIDLFPASALFARADRIITACGFNAMRQAAPFGDRHRFLPFARRYDDQYLRAERYRGRHV